MTCPRVLIVAGSDSGGGAGIQADIKTVTMLGGHAMTAITALTAQNTLGVQAVMPVPADFVVQQMRSCIDDIGVDAVKIGMIGSAPVAQAVADVLQGVDAPVVFDPVMIATSGAVLADTDTIAAFARLMRLATVVTPNTLELSALANMPVENEIDQRKAAEHLVSAFRCGAVLAKGGHLIWDGQTYGTDLNGAPYRYDNSTRVFDVLFDATGSETLWDDARFETQHTHGTGCTLASAIASGLAEKRNLRDAVARARAYVRAALIAAPGLGSGHGPMGHALASIPFDQCPA